MKCVQGHPAGTRAWHGHLTEQPKGWADLPRGGPSSPVAMLQLPCANRGESHERSKLPRENASAHNWPQIFVYFDSINSLVQHRVPRQLFSVQTPHCGGPLCLCLSKRLKLSFKISVWGEGGVVNEGNRMRNRERNRGTKADRRMDIRHTDLSRTGPHSNNPSTANQMKCRRFQGEQCMWSPQKQGCTQ